MPFDGFFMHRIVQQLNEDLAAGKINRIYQISKYELLLNIRANRQNVKFLISCHPNYARLNLTKESYNAPLTPTQLTMTLRKHLEGAFIKSITQLSYERICDMAILGRNEMGDDVMFHLMIEIMGKHSNIILTNEEGNIIDALKRIPLAMSSVRIIQPGARYTYPPLFDNKIDPMQYVGNPYDKMYNEVAGFSPILSKELTCRQTVQPLLQEMMQSDQVYITKGEFKEDYHLCPLTHLGNDTTTYPLYEGLEAFYTKKDVSDRIKQQTSDLNHFIQASLDKLYLKIEKLEAERFDSLNCDDLKLKGELLYASLHLIQKGMSHVTVDNYYTNEPLDIELDVRLDGKGNAKKYFTRYTKQKNALSYVEEQITKALEEIDYFENLQEQMVHASLNDAIEMKEELENLGYIHKKKKADHRQKSKIPHFESYLTKDDIPVFIGKNNLQNDYLTFRYAKKQWHWFHVKDMPGSHVIIATEQELDEYTIRLAANIASLYSKGATSSSVPVNYTRIQTLKKAPGNLPGKVILSHYKTIYIDPEESQLNELIKK